MHLKSLEMKGFKSFPDRKRIDFPQGMICVAGPNGSGKSNILDAIRWVLGEQSIKSLRGEKLEDVIFAGTQSRSQMGYCEVIINIDNEDGQIPIEYSELSIKRKAYRSGESQFFINNQRCRLKDIKELLLDTGIGREGYSLISQGKIDEIVGSNGQELRSLLEEASGIATHRYKKSESEKNLIASKENLERIEDVFREIENQYTPLKTQKEKAEEYLVLTENLKNLQVNKYIRQYRKIDDEILKIKREKEEIEEKYDQNKKIIDEHQTQREGLKNNLNTISNQVDSLKDDFHSNTALIADIESKIKLNQEKIANLHKNNVDIKNQLVEIDEEKEQNQEKNRNLEEEIERVKNSLSQARADLKTKEDLLALKSNLEKETVRESRDIEFKIQSIGSQIDKIMGKTALLQENISSFDSRILQYKIEMEKHQEEIDVREKEKGEVSENLEEKVKLYDDFVQKKEKIDISLSSMESNITNINKDIQDNEIKLNSIQGQTQMLKKFEEDMQGVSKSVRELVKTSNIKGIVDIVSNIVTVQKGYEKAIETLLGGRSENIILKDSSDAREAINYLKENKLGRATFLPLDTVKGKEISYSDVGVRAIDVLSFDEKYRGIVSFLIGKNVIVDDMDTGLYISKKYNQSIKVATKNGEVFNVGGSITGGESKYSNNTFSRKLAIKENEEKIVKLEEKVRELKKALEVSKEKYTDYTIEKQDITINMDKLSKDIENIKNQLSGINFDLNTKNFQKTNMQKEIDSIQKSSETSLKAIEDDIKKVEDYKRQMASMEDELSDKQNQISDIKEEITTKSQEIQNIKLVIVRDEEYYKNQSNILKDIYISISQSDSKIDYLGKKHKKNEENISGIEEDIKVQTDDKEILKERNNDNKNETQIKEKEKEILEEKLSNIENIIQEKTDIILNYDKEKIIKEGEISRNLDKIESINHSLMELYDIDIENAISLEDKDLVVTNDKITLLARQIDSLGNVNIDAIEQFDKISERYEFYKVQIDDLTQSINKINRIIKELETMMIEDFNQSFKVINKNFADIFKTLFAGGDAKLIITDKDDVLTSDIQISVQPPGKKLKKLSMLSGGERALSAIALLFAIITAKPVPFCVLDEIDAPLDDMNIYRYVKFLRTLVDDTQFIVITHRRTTMEECDYMYGVTMQEKGVSTVVSIDMTQVDEYAQE